jgi:hypothetical protein
MIPNFPAFRRLNTSLSGDLFRIDIQWYRLTLSWVPHWPNTKQNCLSLPTALWAFRSIGSNRDSTRPSGISIDPGDIQVLSIGVTASTADRITRFGSLRSCPTDRIDITVNDQGKENLTITLIFQGERHGHDGSRARQIRQ